MKLIHTDHKDTDQKEKKKEKEKGYVHAWLIDGSPAIPFIYKHSKSRDGKSTKNLFSQASDFLKTVYKIT